MAVPCSDPWLVPNLATFRIVDSPRETFEAVRVGLRRGASTSKGGVVTTSTTDATDNADTKFSDKIETCGRHDRSRGLEACRVGDVSSDPPWRTQARGRWAAGLTRTAQDARTAPEEVAQISGVGVTWYTWLEQGRSITASAHVIDALAHGLRLDRENHCHLRHLAGLPTPEPDQMPEGATPELNRLLAALVPAPACLLGQSFDFVAWNETFAALWDPGGLPEVVATSCG